MSTTNHRITLARAIEMTKRYRQTKPESMPICETFDADAVLALVSETGCTSLRIYYGMDNNNDIHAILVAGNKDNADILPPEEVQDDSTGNPAILEDGYRCPKYCPGASPLNS